MNHPTKHLLLAAALAAPLAAQSEYSTLFGRDGDDWIWNMTSDAQGLLYVCGQADRATHVTAGAFQGAHAGGFDAFVACIDPTAATANQLVWSTHLGGTGDETAYALHVDPSGRTVTVVGQTTSTDFPVVGGPQTSHGGASDAFVAVLSVSSAGGTSLAWSSYFGGSGLDAATDVAVQGGEVTMVGTTGSSDLPVQHALQPASGGMRDLFVARLSTSGQAVWSTYLGGRGQEGHYTEVAAARVGGQVVPLLTARAAHVVVDSTGRTTVASATQSPDFPLVGGQVTGSRGGWDLCVARIDATGGALLGTDLLAGDWHEFAGDLVAVGPDRVLIGATTLSTNFPRLPRNTQWNWRGAVLELDLATHSLTQGTILNVNGTMYVFSIYQEGDGTLVAGGIGVGPGMGSPGAPKASTSGWVSSCLTRAAPGGQRRPDYFTFWGTDSRSYTHVILPDGRGGVYAAGATEGVAHPVTAGALDTTTDGSTEGWIANHDMLPANVSRYGRATGGCGALPYLQLNKAPRVLLPDLQAETRDAPAGAAGALVVGVPLPAGRTLLGAELYFDNTFQVMDLVAADANGFAAQRLPMPFGFVWDGSLGLQSVWLPTASCGGSTLITSNALR